MRLHDHSGGDVELAELSSTAYAVVFLPGAFTPVCTSELPAVEQVWEEAGSRGIPVLVVTCDAPPALTAWRTAEGLRMPLISDFWPHGALSQALGAFDDATGRARRVSVVIDAHGGEVWRDEAAPGGSRDMTRLAEALRDL